MKIDNAPLKNNGDENLFDCRKHIKSKVFKVRKVESL